MSDCKDDFIKMVCGDLEPRQPAVKPGSVPSPAPINEGTRASTDIKYGSPTIELDGVTNEKVVGSAIEEFNKQYAEESKAILARLMKSVR